MKHTCRTDLLPTVCSVQVFPRGDDQLARLFEPIEALDIGPLETKDASRVRIRWYVGLAVLRDSAVARMNGVSGI